MPKKPVENGASHDHSHAHGADHDHAHEHEEQEGEEEWEEGMEEEDDDIVVLSDSEGNEREFRFLSILEVDDQQFALLSNVDEPEDPEAATEVFIFHYEADEDGGETFRDIEDETLFEKVQAAAEALLTGGDEE